MSRETLKQASMASPSHAGCGCPMVGYSDEGYRLPAGQLNCIGCGETVRATAEELRAARAADNAYAQLEYREGRAS